MSAPATPLIAWSRFFPASPPQIREARRFLATILDGCPAADDALLCLSELATNASCTATPANPAAASPSTPSGRAITCGSKSATRAAPGPRQR